MMILDLPRKLAGPGQVSEPESWRVLGLSRAGLSRFLAMAQAAAGLRGEVDVLLTGNRTLQRLNREFRGKDKATDVLSFPTFASAPPAAVRASARSPAAAVEGASVSHAENHAGDLAISLEIAQAQAAAHGHSLRDEVRVLLLHGLLHLSGMDHETDRGEMAARETALRQALHLPSSLIARSSAQARVGRRASGSKPGQAEAIGPIRRKAGTQAFGARLGSSARQRDRGEA